MHTKLFVAALAVTALAFGAWLIAAHDQALGGQTNVAGDANCDGTAGAVDAAVILQFDVGLLGALPCPQNADVASYGVINSVDAAVILQFDAGLVASLSTGPTPTPTRTPAVLPTNTIAQPTSTTTPATPTPTRTATPVAGPTPCVSDACPEMVFMVDGLGGRCEGAATAECDVFYNERFMLSVALVAAPAGGYYGVQTLIVPDGLDYDPTADQVDEFAWTDAAGFVLRHTAPWISHGATTAQLPPFPESVYTGALVTLDVGCGAGPSVHTVLLLALSSGTTTGTGLQVAVAEGGPPSRPARGIDVIEIDGETKIVADRLVINCVAP